MPDSPVIIVTGASKGLGLAIAQILLKQYEARVTTISRTISPELQTLVKEYGDDRVHCVQGNVGDLEVNQEAVRKTTSRWDRLDGLVVCAGTMMLDRITDLDLNKATEYTQLNLLASFYIAQAALPHLRKTKGKIVLISSGASTKGYAAWGLYSMAKAGLNSIAGTIASEEKGTGIGCWSIRPGVIDTSMQELLRSDQASKMDPEDAAKFQDLHKAGKLLTPTEPGSVVAGIVVKGGPMEANGAYLDWTDERFSSYRG